METIVFDIDTSERTLVDVTEEVAAWCRALGDGLLNVFVPHATAGLVMVETGAGSEPDLLELLGRLLPRDDRYVHRHGSPGHGADHVLPALVSPSVVIPVAAGELLLGMWQRIVLVDLNRDNPRRSLRCSFLTG